MKIAYFINQYPKVSHTFIRREILALERRGFEVQRIALHGWDAETPDPEDHLEQQRTRYILRSGLAGLIPSVLRAMLVTPARFLAACIAAGRMSRQSRQRPLIYHLAYVAEACAILSELRDGQAGHLHAHFGTNSAEVAMLTRVLGGPAFSFTVHGPEEFAESMGLAEKARHAAFVAAISSFCRSQLYLRMPRTDWPKVQTIHCGLEKAFYDVPAVPVPDVPRLVCVGRLSEEKGQLLLLEAVATLAARNIPIELVLAGDGPLRAEIESCIARLGIARHVRITGWISSAAVREEILAARALVVASFAEGLPVVIMEAMALRRPVIATYVAGIPELVSAAETGWLVPPGSVADLTAAIEACLLATQPHLQQLANASHHRVVLRHSIETETDKLAKLFMAASV